MGCSLSAIICTKDRPKDLKRCIKSIIDQTYHLEELIIIDSGKDQKIEIDKYIDKYIDKNSYNIKYINYISSLTAARNIGISQSTGDIILFLDDDVILDENYLYNIIQIFKNHDSSIGCACGDITSDIIRSDRFPKLIEYSSIKKIRNFIFNTLFLTSWGDGRFHPSGFPTYPIGKKDIMFIECLPGANMAFRREVLDKFRFDENLKGYCYMEDCDISYRVSREYKIIYTPYAKLVHNVSPISRYSDYSKMKMAIQNHYYIFNKNFPKNSYNRFAFWSSVFGLYFICFLGVRKEGIKGLHDGLRIIIQQER